MKQLKMNSTCKLDITSMFELESKHAATEIVSKSSWKSILPISHECHCFVTWLERNPSQSCLRLHSARFGKTLWLIYKYYRKYQTCAILARNRNLLVSSNDVDHGEKPINSSLLGSDDDVLSAHVNHSEEG